MDDERDTTKQPLPDSVSNQNGEEAEPDQSGGPSGGTDTSAGDGAGKSSDAGKHPSGGDSGEGSQSTGDRRSAG